MLVRQFRLGNNFPTYIGENTDFPRQKPRQFRVPRRISKAVRNGSYSFAYFFWTLITINMKFGQILVYLKTAFLTCFWFNAGDWKLVSAFFYSFNEMAI